MPDHRFSHRWEMVIIHEDQMRRWVPVNDIIYCDIHGHYGQIHISDGQIIRVRMTFSELSAIVLPYPQFLECYRGCIINMAHARRMEDMNFLMDTGERVPYRKKEQHVLMRKYSGYLFDEARSESV